MGLKNKQVWIVLFLQPNVGSGLTGAIGIISKAGRYGGTYDHKDIALGINRDRHLYIAL